MDSKWVYAWMEESWETYALMSAIIYIEEMSKPTTHKQVKRYKDRKYNCICFHGIRLKMNNEIVVKKIFDLTKHWENKKGLQFIGSSFSVPRKESYSNQDIFYLTPCWLNEMMATCGKLPNTYSNDTALKRLQNLVQYAYKPVDQTNNLFGIFLTDEKLAAGAFIVSMDMECRGIQSGAVSLCMSEKYKDFLEFMRTVAEKWGWTKNKCLQSVDVSYSRRRGILASEQFQFNISIKGLGEIYELAGPLADPLKEKCIRFNVNRSENYRNIGGNSRKNHTCNKILNALISYGEKGTTTTELQFVAGTRTDVVCDHLNRLEDAGLAIKARKGKRNIWKAATVSSSTVI